MIRPDILGQRGIAPRQLSSFPQTEIRMILRDDWRNEEHENSDTKGHAHTSLLIDSPTLPDSSDSFRLIRLFPTHPTLSDSSDSFRLVVLLIHSSPEDPSTKRSEPVQHVIHIAEVH